MEFMELVKDRYSVRKFDPRPIEPEVLERVLEAGRLAPTAVNYQPQRVLVMNTPESLEKLKGLTRLFFDPPAALLICYDRDVSWKRPDGIEVGSTDAVIVATHMLLAAHDQGLGACWIGMFDIDGLHQAFGIPENVVPTALLYLGYPAANSKPIQMHYDRLPLDKTVFFNRMD